MNAKKTVIEAIGNTPLLELKHLVPAGAARVFAKMESANPTGSMKDRVAKAVIEGAVRRKWLKPGDTVVEYTAGTTGISLAFVCAALGYRFHAVFSDAFSNEKRIMMKALGAEITDIVSDNKKITQDLIKEMISRSKTLSEQPDHWWADQLNSEDGASGYHSLGEEIWNQLDGQVDAFVHAVGTSHSIHGVAEILYDKNHQVKIIAIEPDESAVLSGRASGSHKIEGIGIGFVPPKWNRELVNEIRTVTTGQAMDMARRLAKEEGIFAGTSTGANVLTAIEIAKELGLGKTVVTLVIDTGLRYISTPLYQSI